MFQCATHQALIEAVEYISFKHRINQMDSDRESGEEIHYPNTSQVLEYWQRTIALHGADFGAGDWRCHTATHAPTYFP